jgi:Insertion element 4 transposase N-terminal
VSFYRVSPSAAACFGDEAGTLVAVRAADLVAPSARPAGAGASALAVAGTERIRSGDEVVFLKVVHAGRAVVRRDGRVQAKGSPCEHATLGPLEDRLDLAAGPGVIDRIAGGARLQGRVTGERRRLLPAAFVLRAVVLMTLMPDADAREVITALAGDLALVPWSRPWRSASPQALRDWRQALGPGPAEELQAIVLEAALAGHRQRDWAAAPAGGLRAGAIDGTLIRVPDTPGNRAVLGSPGTGDDTAPFPSLRALLLSDASTRATLGMIHGPSGGDKAAGEQALLDQAMRDPPHLFTMDRIWIMDRNFPGAARIARLIERTHVLIRLRIDIRIDPVLPFLPDGSCLADLHRGRSASASSSTASGWNARRCPKCSAWSRTCSTATLTRRGSSRDSTGGGGTDRRPPCASQVRHHRDPLRHPQLPRRRRRAQQGPGHDRPKPPPRPQVQGCPGLPPRRPEPADQDCKGHDQRL